MNQKEIMKSLMTALGYEEMKKVCVKVKPLDDPALKGKAIARKGPGSSFVFTEEPTEVYLDFEVERLLEKGILVLCDCENGCNIEDLEDKE